MAAEKKWRDSGKIWAEYKGTPRKEVVANYRLKTGHDCLAAHLRKTGMYESIECTICRMADSTIALNSIPTNKCLRTPSNSTVMPE